MSDVGEKIRRAVSAALDRVAADATAIAEAEAERAAEEAAARALDEHECDHSGCTADEDVEAIREEARREADLPWEILESLGVDRRECEGMFLGAGYGGGPHPLDRIRHLRRMPGFRAAVLREVEAIREQEAAESERRRTDGTARRARCPEID